MVHYYKYYSGALNINTVVRLERGEKGAINQLTVNERFAA